MTPRQDTRQSPADTLEARLGARFAAVLGEQASQVPHDISERLRVAREQAVGRARDLRAAQPAVALRKPQPAGAWLATGGGAVMLGGPPPWWLRLATVLPLVLLVSGLVLIEQWNTREQVMAAAEIDVELLADDVPPDAWVDAGFREFLKSPTP